MNSSEGRQEKEQKNPQHVSPEEKREREERAKQSKHKQELLDDEIEQTFPASDPPSISRVD